MGRFLFFCAFLLGSIGSWAQAPSLPFIKLAHLGTEGRPILDLYLTTQLPALDPAAGLTSRYRFESVCLLSEVEFTALLRYAESYTAQHQSEGRNEKYGTFELTLGASLPTRTFVYSRSKSLAWLTGALPVLKQAAGSDQSEALRRLEATTRRLSAPAK